MGKYDIIKAKIEIKKRKKMILVKMINLIAMDIIFNLHRILFYIRFNSSIYICLKGFVLLFLGCL